MPMDSTPLTERESEVLRALVEAHVEVGVAVGSRTLCRRENWAVSSATVRNTLVRLEDKGLVEQPHASAGRVPTDRGYRFYVAQRMREDGFGSESDDGQLQDQLDERLQEGGFQEILGQLAHVLGEVSHQLGVVMAPSFESCWW
jgi:heat-inducible transcriptional repressor